MQGSEGGELYENYLSCLNTFCINTKLLKNKIYCAPETYISVTPTDSIKGEREKEEKDNRI